MGRRKRYRRGERSCMEEERDRKLEGKAQMERERKRRREKPEVVDVRKNMKIREKIRETAKGPTNQHEVDTEDLKKFATCSLYPMRGEVKVLVIENIRQGREEKKVQSQ